MTEAAWYAHFFEGPVVEYWTNALEEEQTLAEVAFLQHELGLRSGQRILDAPAGMGRLAIPLAEAGYALTAVDISSEFVGIGQQWAAERELFVDWQVKDIAAYRTEQLFDAVICMGNSFGYTDSAGSQHFLNVLAQSLKPGGNLALHTGMIAEAFYPNFQPKEWHHVGQVLMTTEHFPDPESGCVETDYHFYREGKAPDQRTSFHWVFTLRELLDMLEVAELEPTGIYADTDSTPYEFGDPELYLVARKN